VIRGLHELATGLFVFVGTTLGVPVLIWALILLPFAA
jgi:hypothetical protein